MAGVAAYPDRVSAARRRFGPRQRSRGLDDCQHYGGLLRRLVDLRASGKVLALRPVIVRRRDQLGQVISGRETCRPQDASGADPRRYPPGPAIDQLPAAEWRAQPDLL